ncbi:Transcription factor iws1 [Chytriomyces hyalinus]|nr:Transcription factor iws1 [Chytriomyces hyalinus]
MDESDTEPTQLLDQQEPLSEAQADDGKRNITLDDIFGGGGDSDLDDDDLALSSDDEANVPPPKVLPSFKKKVQLDEDLSAPVEKRPSKKKQQQPGSQKKSRSSNDNAPDEPEKELDPESAAKKQVSDDFQEALNRIKTKRAKKLDGDDPEIDEMIVNLVDKMKEAANADQEFNRKQQPAIAKIKLLPTVTMQLSKAHLYEQFLDNNILDGMKLWLEPLTTDGSLPNLDVQMTIFNALGKFPIRTEHLRESKIGRVVMFYTKCDRVTPSALRIVNDLLEKWMRPILGRSQSYKERGLQTVQFDASDMKKRKVNLDNHEGAEERFTRVPKPTQQSFKVMPASNFGRVFETGDGKEKAVGGKGKKAKTLMQSFQKKKR